MNQHDTSDAFALAYDEPVDQKASRSQRSALGIAAVEVLLFGLGAGLVQAASHLRIEAALLAPLGTSLLVCGAARARPAGGLAIGALFGMVVGTGFVTQAPGWIAAVVGGFAFVVLSGVLGAIASAAAARGSWSLLVAVPATAAVYEGATGAVSPLGDYLGLAGAAAGVPGLTGLAGLGGLPLVAAATAGLGAALGALALVRHRRPGAAAAVLWLLLCLLGPRPHSASTVRVAAVALSEADRAGSGRAIAEALGELTGRAASRGAAFVVWPEAAVRARSATSGDPAFDAASAAASAHDVTVVAGLFDRATDRNLAVLFEPSGREAARYAKRHLIPGMESYIAGTSPSGAVDSAALGLSVALQICFDDCFRDGSAALADARLLALPTNDWPRVANRHRRLSILRAAQGRVAIVRAASGGWSQILDPRGTVIAEERSGVAPVVLVADVSVR